MRPRLTETARTASAVLSRASDLPEGSPWEGFNDSNQVVGIRTIDIGVPGQDGPSRAFIWDRDNGYADIVPVTHFPGTYQESEPNAINNHGQVVGRAFFDGPLDPWGFVTPVGRAFLWTREGGIRNLGTLNLEPDPRLTQSWAYDINNTGTVVGYSDGRPFIWDEADGMRDLNSLLPPDSNWMLKTATAINDQGDIIGVGDYSGPDALGGLETRPFLMKRALRPANLCARHWW